MLGKLLGRDVSDWSRRPGDQFWGSRLKLRFGKLPYGTPFMTRPKDTKKKNTNQN